MPFNFELNEVKCSVWFLVFYVLLDKNMERFVGLDFMARVKEGTETSDF